MIEECRKVIVLFNCAGNGARVGTKMPKQYIKVTEYPLFVQSLREMENTPEIDEIIPIIQKEYKDIFYEWANRYCSHKISQYYVIGGETAQESRWNGIKYLKDKNYFDETIVLLHDAVRPLVTNVDFNKIIKKIKEVNSFVTVGTYHNGTILYEGKEGKYKTVTDKEPTMICEMPFGSPLNKLYNAYNNEGKRNRTAGPNDMIDEDCYCIEIPYLHGMKVTYYEDFYLLRLLF